MTSKPDGARRGAGDAKFVEFIDVEKMYGHFHAVRRLNLSIGRGEFLTFLGPSGSGKTTTLNMLAGFERPSQGVITLDGKSVDRLPPYERNIGMVFQNYALFPHMSVADNVAFPLSVRKIAEGRHRTARRARPRNGAAGAIQGPQAGPALGRPAAARRARPRAGLPADPRSDGRAARRARQEAARAHADRVEADPRDARRHHRLCDARPERSADDVGSRRRLRQRAPSFRSERRTGSTRSRRPPSSRASSAKTMRWTE